MGSRPGCAAPIPCGPAPARGRTSPRAAAGRRACRAACRRPQSASSSSIRPRLLLGLQPVCQRAHRALDRLLIERLRDLGKLLVLGEDHALQRDHFAVQHELAADDQRFAQRRFDVAAVACASAAPADAKRSCGPRSWPRTAPPCSGSADTVSWWKRRRAAPRFPYWLPHSRFRRIPAAPRHRMTARVSSSGRACGRPRPRRFALFASPGFVIAISEPCL